MSDQKIRFHSIEVDKIVIGERFRTDLGGKFNDLVESIREHGLFHPIVLTRDNVLLAGFRRVQSHKQLNLPIISCQFFDEIDELTSREIELEENYARADLDWLDEDRLRYEINELKRKKYGDHYAGMGGQGNTGDTSGWDYQDTAQALGVSATTVGRSVARIEALQYLPELAEAPTRKAADREIDRLCQEIETELNLRRRNREAQVLTEFLQLGDCVNLLASLATDSIDCIVTDPPYGVDIKTSTHDGGHRTPAEYDDDPVSIHAMLRSAFKEMKRALKPSGHCYIFCSSRPEDQIRIIGLLFEAGFDIEPIPLVWCKDTHTTVDWDYRYAPSYESILFCSNRQRRLDHKRENVFVFSNVDTTLHTAQKPIALLSEFVAMSTSVGEVILDPFMGSGSTVIAAIRCDRRYIGMEHNESIYNAAKLRIMNELESRRAPSETEVNEEIAEDELV